MNSRLLCVLTGSILLAGCGTTTATTQHPSPVPATATAIPAATTAATQISSVSEPKDPYKAGVVEYKGHNYAVAAKRFQQAINAHRNVAAAYAGLGNAELRLGKYADGYHAFVKATNLAPKNPQYLYGAALGAYTVKQYPTTIQYASRFIHLEPKAASGYHLRMLAYSSLARAKPQLADARAIVRLAPRNAQAYNDLGIAYGNNKQYPQALAAFGRAIALSKKSYSFYFNRAVVENLIKEKAAALTDMKKAEALAPTSTSKQAIAAYARSMQQSK
jgi:tetratricopeptide (TPR) repeat protein